MIKTIPTSFITNLNKRSSIVIATDYNELDNLLPSNGFVFIDKKVYEKFNDSLLFKHDYSVYVIDTDDIKRNIECIPSVCKKFVELRIQREDNIIVIGGKKLIDIYGFAITIFNRNLNFYMIPTTLLAMTDTSIGGIYHLNASEFVRDDVKIQSYPLKVLICPNIAKYTDEETFRSGLANMLKIGCIDNLPLLTKMQSVFHFIKDKREIEDDKLADMIEDALQSKIQVYLNDEVRAFAYGFGDKLAYYYASFVNPNCKYSHSGTIGMELTLDIMSNYLHIADVMTEYQKYSINCMLRAINPTLDQDIENAKEKLVEVLESDLPKNPMPLTYFKKLGQKPVVLQVPKSIIIDAIKNHKPYNY